MPSPWMAALALVTACLQAGGVPGSGDAKPLSGAPDVVGLQSVDTLDADHAWAVGFDARGSSSRTLVEHWDGAQWSAVESPNPGRSHLNRLDAVYAAADDDVWAVGSFDSKGHGALHNLAMHWDGGKWTVINPPDRAPLRRNALLSVTGTAGNDVWAGGYFVDADGFTQATLYEWDGTSWSDAHVIRGPVGDPAKGLVALGDSAWAVGECTMGCPSKGQDGIIARWAAGKWKGIKTPNLGHLVDIAGTDPEDLWAVGDGRVSHDEGSGWQVTSGPGIGILSAVTTPAANFTMVAGPESAAFSTGGSWTRVPVPRVGTIADVDLSSAEEGWAVGTTGRDALIEHWDGTQFQRLAAGRQGSRGVCYSNIHDDSQFDAASQMSPDDPGIESRGAAGFTLHQPCVVGLIEVIGSYRVLNGPAKSETVTFYTDSNGEPGDVVARRTVTGADFQGSFVIPLHAVHLAAGAYFVSVAVHMNKAEGGIWFWELTSNVNGEVDQWENPGGDLSACTTWGDVGTCNGMPGAQLDFMVTLYR